MITVRDIEQFLYDWAPPDTAESWDNVGLLVGRPDRPVRRVLVALDVTPAVAAEACAPGCCNWMKNFASYLCTASTSRCRSGASAGPRTASWQGSLPPAPSTTRVTSLMISPTPPFARAS